MNRKLKCGKRLVAALLSFLMVFSNIGSNVSFAAAGLTPAVKAKTVSGDDDAVFSVSAQDLLAAVEKGEAAAAEAAKTSVEGPGAAITTASASNAEKTAAGPGVKAVVASASNASASNAKKSGTTEDTVKKQLGADYEIAPAYTGKANTDKMTVRTFVKGDTLIFWYTNSDDMARFAKIEINGYYTESVRVSKMSDDGAPGTEKSELPISSVREVSKAAPLTYPEFNDEVQVGDATITLHAEEGIIPEGIHAEATEVTEELGDKIKEKMEETDTDKKVTGVVAYDIKLVDQKNNVLADSDWQGSVEVTITSPEIKEAAKEADSLEVSHVDTRSSEKLSADNAASVSKDELKVEKVTEKNVTAGEAAAMNSIVFDATHFSVYAITLKKNAYSVGATINIQPRDTSNQDISGNIAVDAKTYFVNNNNLSSVAAATDAIVADTTSGFGLGTNYTFVKAELANGTKITKLGYSQGKI